MKSRREWGSYASGLAQSFVSRNNDLNGYWAMGQLFRFAREQGVSALVLDLLAQSMQPEAPQFAPVLRHYHHWLLALLQRKQVALDGLHKAVLTLDFQPVQRLGFLCQVELVDERGKCYRAVARGECWPHDPAREMRRIREHRIV